MKTCETNFIIEELHFKSNIKTPSHFLTFQWHFSFSFANFQDPHTTRTQIQNRMALISSTGVFYWNDRRHEVYFLQKSGSDQRDSEMISFSNDQLCTRDSVAAGIDESRSVNFGILWEVRINWISGNRGHELQ